MSETMPPPEGATLARSILPDFPPTFRHLDPAATIAFRTPLQEHPPAADTKAAAILTAFGIMFALLAKYEVQLGPMLQAGGLAGLLGGALLLGFAILSLCAIVQAFRTISPRFPKAPPSLAFFEDIARLPRVEYVARMEALSHEEALLHILNYNHTLASICVEKFRHFRVALKFFLGAFACWLLLVLEVHYWIFAR